ncbi:MAG: zinc ribbon domain-containing protein [Patescibacteria group bacterium]|nr:zinc ribbon domain-containing protein [Patescibacteria group bacterium]
MEIKICQSCGMPMKRIKDYGIFPNKNRSKEYCHFCFQEGKFVDPDITIEQMINRVAVVMADKMKMTERQARGMAENFLPSLKRWHC